MDADRDGVVEKNNPNKVTLFLPCMGSPWACRRPAHPSCCVPIASLSPSVAFQASWTWGPEGHGAILLVSCDRESPLSPAPDCDDERVFSKEGNAVPSPAPLQKNKQKRCYSPLFNLFRHEGLLGNWLLSALTQLSC